MNRILRFTNPNSWPTESVLRCDLYENIEPPDLDQESISFLTECTQAQWEISETRPSKRRKIKRDEKEPFDTRNETFGLYLALPNAISTESTSLPSFVRPQRPLSSYSSTSTCTKVSLQTLCFSVENSPSTVGYPPPTEDTSIQAENRRSRAEAAAVDIGWLLSERDKPLKVCFSHFLQLL